MVDVEIIPPPETPRGPRVNLVHLRALGLGGAFLAVLTMLAALGIGLLALFGTTLLVSIMVYVAWPLIFSADFTKWVFGTEHVAFWKIFLLCLLIGSAYKIFRFKRN